jgi:ADP-ribose pyrophosphatase
VRSSSTEAANEGWRIDSAQTHYKDAHLAVATELVQTPAHGPRYWTTVRRKPTVIIAPLTREGKFLLVHQERVPLRMSMWEMPAGQIDSDQSVEAGEVRATAERELYEETGYRLGRDGELVPLGDYFTSPGFTDEHGYFFLARGIDRAGDYTPDTSEGIIECRAFSVSELSRMVAKNEIRDANTLGICARMAALGLLKFETER